MEHRAQQVLPVRKVLVVLQVLRDLLALPAHKVLLVHKVPLALKVWQAQLVLMVLLAPKVP